MKQHEHMMKHDEQPVYLSNGMIGLRIQRNPFHHMAVYLNGYIAAPMEVCPQAPNPLGFDLEVAGQRMSAHPDRVRFDSQTYDFATGELSTCCHFEAGAVRVEIAVLTFCCRTAPLVMAQEVRLTCNTRCDLIIETLITTAGLPGRCLEQGHPDRLGDAYLHWESPGAAATCGTAATATVTDDQGHVVAAEPMSPQSPLSKRCRVSCTAGRALTVRQLGSLTPGILHAEPHFQAARQLCPASWRGFDLLRQDNRAAWGEIWRGRILLHGAEPRWQDALDSAYYYLHASAHESMPCSVGPFGMSPGYSAHKFWDTETFMFPPILLTAPASARAMLDYRTRMLPSARAAAAMSGYAGIQFPWQSGNSGGEVTTLPWSPAAINQQHINTDVAFAFCQYVAATGDREFERNQAWPVVGGVAEWLASRVSRTARGYEIRHIVGADERIENVHNNGYTNMCAVVILREAVAMATRLGLFAPGAWSEIADHLYIPVDPEGGFIRKHDAYVHNPEHMCIPDTLMGLYPFPYRHSPSVDDATIRYHLGLLDRFWGMPMWASSLGVFAARLGDRALAARLFERGVLEYIAQPYHAYCEFSPGLPPVATGEMKMHSPFLTNAAGFVMACLFGLPGIVVDSGDPKAWPRHPVVLPSGWDTIEVERIWVRGKPARLLARQGTSRAQIEWTA